MQKHKASIKILNHKTIYQVSKVKQTNRHLPSIWSWDGPSCSVRSSQDATFLPRAAPPPCPVHTLTPPWSSQTQSLFLSADFPPDWTPWSYNLEGNWTCQHAGGHMLDEAEQFQHAKLDVKLISKLVPQWHTGKRRCFSVHPIPSFSRHQAVLPLLSQWEMGTEWSYLGALGWLRNIR